MSVIDRLVETNFDRRLLVHHPHIWAVRFPTMVTAAVGVGFLSILISIVGICYFDGDPITVLSLASAVYISLLYTWGALQPMHVMPDGQRLVRQAGDDAAIGVVAFPVAFLLGAAVYGPLLGAIVLEGKMENSEARVRDLVRGLQLGSAYFPDRHRTTAETLTSNDLMQLGADPKTVQSHVQGVLARRDRNRAVADLEQFANALRSVDSEEIRVDLRACADSIFTGDRFKILSCRDLEYRQVYGFSGSRWSRDIFIIRIANAEWMVKLAAALGLVSLWAAVALACNTNLKPQFVMAAFATTGVFLMLIGSDLDKEGPGVYTTIALWVVFAGSMLILVLVPRLRVTGADALGGTALAAIIVIAGKLFMPGREVDIAAPNAAGVLALSILAMPYVNYVRKRAVVAPES